MAKAAATVLLALLAATDVSAQTSSEKVRDNPAAQYVLAKTIVGQSTGVVKGRALPLGIGGYNLLQYCWTPFNVLGEWGERSGVAGEMVVRALETLSWSRDLVRVGYPQAEVVDTIGRYEAALALSGFTNAARVRALDRLGNDLAGLRHRTPGAAPVSAEWRCDMQPTSLGLNHKTAPDGGRARFIPWVLHQFCQAQQLRADDPSACDYWLTADGPMSFAGETVYSVQWPDGTTGTGRFNPDEQRGAGTVTLRERPPKK